MNWRPRLDGVTLPSGIAALYERALAGEKETRPTAAELQAAARAEAERLEGGAFTTSTLGGAIQQLDRSQQSHFGSRGLAM